MLLIFAVLAVAWVSAREWLRPGQGSRGSSQPEPAWRQLLRVGFGVIWIFDGLLQAQPAMAAGLPSQVIEPTAASSPAWVQHVVNWAGTTWSYHPIQAGASAVWIQIGIGVWLIAAPRGFWSRLAGLASVAWGLVVWVFGEAFGGIFAPGLTWLFGAPGAALFYCAAGRPDRTARAQLATPRGSAGRCCPCWGVLHRHGRAAGLAGTGLLAGHGARPAGHAHRHGQLDGQHAAAGLFAGLGAQLRVVHRRARLRGEPVRRDRAGGHRGGPGQRRPPGGPAGAGSWLARATVIATVALCLADWVLIEDFGFFGGLGTDPNSMIPIILLVGGRLPGAGPGPRPGGGARDRGTGRPGHRISRRGRGSLRRPAGWRGRSARRAPGRSWPPGRSR